MNIDFYVEFVQNSNEGETAIGPYASKESAILDAEVISETLGHAFVVAIDHNTGDEVGMRLFYQGQEDPFSKEGTLA